MIITKGPFLYGAILAVVGVVLLIVAFVTPWYQMQASLGGRGPSSGTVTEQYWLNDQVTASLGGTSVSSSYSTVHLNSTGNLYTAATALVILGILFGAVATVLGLLAGSRPNWWKGAVALAVVAFLLAILGPLVLFAAQPGAINSDQGSTYGSSTGIKSPANSFYGSQSANNATITWGPTTGWFLSIVGGAVFLVSAVLTLRGRKSAPALAAAPTPPAATYGTASAEGSPASTIPAYSCPYCGSTFATAAELGDHSMTSHRRY